MTHPTIKRHRTTRAGGFTILEVVITVMVLLVIVGFAVPRLSAGRHATSDATAKATLTALASTAFDLHDRDGSFQEGNALNDLDTGTHRADVIGNSAHPDGSMNTGQVSYAATVDGNAFGAAVRAADGSCWMIQGDITRLGAAIKWSLLEAADPAPPCTGGLALCTGSVPGTGDGRSADQPALYTADALQGAYASDTDAEPGPDRCGAATLTDVTGPEPSPDPGTATWAAVGGGSAVHDTVTSMAVGANGTIYLAGRYGGTPQGILQGGPTVAAGKSGAFIVAVDPDTAEPLWATYSDTIGTASTAFTPDIWVGTVGNDLYAAYEYFTATPDGFATGLPAADPVNDDNKLAVTRLDPATGSVTWHAPADGVFNYLTDFVADPSGLYVAGYRTFAVSASPSGFLSSLTNPDRGFVAKLDPATGALSWVRAHGETNSDRAVDGIAIDGGRLFVQGNYADNPTGYLSGVGLPNPSTQSRTQFSYVAALDATTGATTWARYGNAFVSPNSTITGRGGKVYVHDAYYQGGVGYLAALPGDAGLYHNALTIFDGTAGTTLTQLYGGPVNMHATAIGVDAAGDIYLIGNGNENGTGFMADLGPFSAAADPYLLKMNQAGTHIWKDTGFGAGTSGSPTLSYKALLVTDDHLYTAGAYWSSTAGPLVELGEPAPNGGSHSDAFLIRYEP